MGRVQDAVKPLGSLDLVPLDGIHLTLHRIGTIDEVDAHQIQAVAAIATRMLSTCEPFELQIGPLAGSAGAIRFSVSPWTEISRLYNLLAALSVTEVGTPTKGIRPHLSIAYNNRERAAAPVISAVGQLRSLNPAFTNIDAVHLVTLRRDGHMYIWETLHIVSFGGAGKS